MNKLLTCIVTAALMTGVSVCGAELGSVANNASAVCKDGVCEIALPAAGNEAKDGLAASANPYHNAVPDVEGKWETEMKLGPHDLFVASASEPQVGIVFLVNAPIRNFKVLSLHLKDFSAEGKPVFLVKELYTKDVLRPERPLLVRTSFPGSIPNNGFSYTDPKGKTRYYAVSQSGMDGSVVFSEF